MKKAAYKFPYIHALFFVLALVSGIGIGYIYGTSREIKLMTMVLCKVSGIGA